MDFEQFEIGTEFYCGNKKWRCTDKGTRVVVAVCLTDHEDDESWYSGPPYAVMESVFDEYDTKGCSLKKISN